MNRIHIFFLCGLILAGMTMAGCATKRKKGETGKVKTFFHNMNSKYNGYFNADEIMKESLSTLETSNSDNYYEILNVYPYGDKTAAKSVSPNLDIAIEKVTTVATLHKPGHWVDDCYVLMGKAQYLKQDYESAEETLEYFQEEFDPGNPYGRAYDKNKGKKSAKEIKKAREEEKEQEAKKREEDREARDKEKKAKREEEAKKREEARKKKKKEQEAKKKAREEERKRKKKKSKKKKRKGKKRKERAPKTEETPKKESETPSPETTSKEDNTEKPLSKTDDNSNKEVEKVDKQQENPEEEDKEESSTKKKPITRYPDGDAGIFGHAPSFYEGVLWLSKTYMEREKYSYAEYLLNKLENEYPSGSDVSKSIPAARAHLYLKQEQYSQAINMLNEAISVEKNKSIKARYAYIIAQIQERNGAYTEALDSYQRVRSFRPTQIMEFNALLNSIKLEARTNDNENIIKQIEKLLKETKYSEYKDQIYYTLGEVKFLNNDKDGAIAAFENSLEYSKGNQIQNLESNYRLATLLYESEDYVASKKYYDNTAQIMEKQDSRYPEVKRFSESLTDIAKNIEIISLQDSLITIATMSKDDRIELAKKLKEQEKTFDLSDEKTTEESGNKGIVRSGLRGNSTFFAYNTAAKINGAQVFQTKWGDRVLEDNWRRSKKLGGSQIADTNDEENIQIQEEDQELSDAEMARIFSDVPFSEAQRAKANKMLRDAYFDLGVAFRDKIKNYKKSNEALGILETRFPKSPKEQDAFYYQYLSYGDLNNMAKANEYKAKIISRFPESKFALLLNDPSYAEQLLTSEQKLQNYYDETYVLFQNNNYNAVRERLGAVDQMYDSKHPLKSKFALLEAMTIGQADGKEAYLSALKNVTTRHPNTPEEKRAKEIMRFLRGNQNAFDEVLYDEALEKFTLSDNKLHYVIAVLFDSNDKKKRDAKIAITGYNKKYNKLDKLRVTDIYLSTKDKTQIVLVRKFKNKEKAMDYYETVMANKSEYIDDSIAYELYAVTQKNYREIIKQKSISDYKVFFEAKYLEKK